MIHMHLIIKFSEHCTPSSELDPTEHCFGDTVFLFLQLPLLLFTSFFFSVIAVNQIVEIIHRSGTVNRSYSAYIVVYSIFILRFIILHTNAFIWFYLSSFPNIIGTRISELRSSSRSSSRMGDLFPFTLHHLTRTKYITDDHLTLNRKSMQDFLLVWFTSSKQP